MNNAIDTENGGIFTFLDEKGRVYGRKKNVWFQGRALYIYSSVYNTVEKRPEWLQKTCLNFFLSGDENGRLHFIADPTVKVIERNEYFYSEAVAAIGCAEYYLASGNAEAKSAAEKYFDIVYRIHTAPKNAAYKELGPSMILLSTAQVLRKINHDKYNKIAIDTIGEILAHFNGSVLLENIAQDGSFEDSPDGRCINPGHSLETSWFLMYEGMIQNNTELQLTAKKIIDNTMEIGYCGEGIIAFAECKGFSPEQLEWDMKIWWPQCEAMIANRLCYEIFHEDKYMRQFKALENFVFTHFADNENGEWCAYLHYDNTLASTLKGNLSKRPFHLPRMLMMIERINSGAPLF